LWSVKRICYAGNTVVFNGQRGSYIQNKDSKVTTPIKEVEGEYVYDIWVRSLGNAMKKKGNETEVHNKYGALETMEEEKRAINTVGRGGDSVFGRLL
jgi:hypothetical protein